MDQEINKLSDDIKKLSIKKISPFSGGLKNNAKVEETHYIKINELSKNKENIDIIVNYLNKYKLGADNHIKGIILRGPIGSGKMTVLNSCIKHTNYTSHLYDTDYESDDIYNNLIISIVAKGITKLFSNEKRVIVIRDIDNALKITQKKNLFKFLVDTKNTMPVLMTSSDVSIGTTREVPKSILQLNIECLSINDFLKIGQKIVLEDSIKVSLNAIEKIANECNHDIRFFINTIKGIKHNPKKVSIRNLHDFSKDHELDTFKRIKYCADINHDFEERTRYADMYTNSTIFHNYPNMTSDIQKLDKTSEIICAAEEIRNYVCNNQIWDTMDESYGLLGTVYTLNIIGCVPNTDLFTYPPNYLSSYSRFDKLDQDAYIMKNIIKPKYFSKKFDTENLESLQQDTKDIEDPIKSYKLGSLLESTKDTNSFLNKFKKELIKTNHLSTRKDD